MEGELTEKEKEMAQINKGFPSIDRNHRAVNTAKVSQNP